MNEKPKSARSQRFRIFVGSCIAVAVILLTVLIFLAPKLIKDAKLRALMADVKAGKRTTVIDPDPSLLEDSLQDREAELKQLQELEVADGDVTDAGLEHLKHLTQLKELDLCYTVFTKQGIADLQKALPNCKITIDEAGGEEERKTKETH